MLLFSTVHFKSGPLRIKVNLLSSLFICILILSAAIPTNAQQMGKPIVIERSPFESAVFYVNRGDDDEIATDAQVYDTPPGYLTVTFRKIMKDKMDGQPLPFEKVKWSQVEIKVDPAEKGMSLSYTRDGGQFGPPNKVILHVPTEQDEKVWCQTAETHLIKYYGRFYELKSYFKEQEQKENKKKKALEEKLKEPVIVYPK